MKKSAVAAIFFSILSFAGSDWCIGLTIGDILMTLGMSTLRASLIAVAMLYLLTLLAALAILPTRWGGSSPARLTYPGEIGATAFPTPPAGTWR